MKKLIGVFLPFAVALCAQAGVRADLREGGKLYEDQKYGQALAKYNEALQKAPQDENASFGAGAAAYYLKDYRTAEKAFEETAEKDGKLVQDALFNLGNAYYRAGDTDKAADAYRKAIVHNPKDKEAIHNLQLILDQKQNQQNQNNQNQQNQDNNSSNQDRQNQDGKGQAEQNGQDPQSPSNPQDQMNKDDANRVMQMARENEYKKPTQSGAAQGSSVEKDW